MTLQWLLGWWNLIFLAPFAVALLYLFVYTLSGLGFGEVDAHGDAHGDFDADADADADMDADAHVDVDADADGELDADADADADGDGDAHESGQTSAHSMALSWLGVGRVPLSLIAVVLLLTWGAAGFVANAIMRPQVDWDAARVSLPAALIFALFVTRSVVLLMGRFVPLNETYARRRAELVGHVGEALYGIDERFGLAAVRDDRGDLHQVTCRLAPGLEPIARGTRVKLVAYRANEGVFFVRNVN
jgi:hypothetical protein